MPSRPGLVVVDATLATVATLVRFVDCLWARQSTVNKHKRRRGRKKETFRSIGHNEKKMATDKTKWREKYDVDNGKAAECSLAAAAEHAL